MAAPTIHPFSWERMIHAVERVRESVVKAATVFDQNRIPYCLDGDNAVEAHVRRADESAVRTSKDVEFLIRPDDIQNAPTLLIDSGLQCVRLLVAGELARPHHIEPAPDVEEYECVRDIRVFRPASLVRMKLVWFRDVDRTHLRDLIEVGLVDQSWTTRLPEKLAARLQQRLDTPDG